MEITFILKNSIRDAQLFDGDDETPHLADIPLAFDGSHRLIFEGPPSVIEARDFVLPAALEPYLDYALVEQDKLMPTHRMAQGVYRCKDTKAECQVTRHPVKVDLGLAEPYGRAQYSVIVRAPKLSDALMTFSRLMKGELHPDESWESSR